MKRAAVPAILGLTLAASLAGCCGGPPEPAAGRFTFRGAAGSVAVSTSPVGFELQTPAGEVLLGGTGAGLELGALDVVRENRFNDPANPGAAQFYPVSGLSSVTAGPGRIAFAADSAVADAVWIAIDEPVAGALRISVTVDGPRGVVLTRLKLREAAGAIDHALVGGGELFDAVDSRGRVREMQLRSSAASESGMNEVHVPVPFFVSTAGWGLFVAEHSAGAFDLGATDPAELSVTFEGAGMTFYLLQGPSAAEIVALYTRLTGLPRLPPRWAFAPQSWRNVSLDAAEVLSDAARLRSLDIPGSVLWIDNPWQTGYNTFDFDPARFPDPAGLVGALHALGYRVLLWSTPYAVPAPASQPLYDEGRASGYFITDAAGFVWPVPFDGQGTSGMVDFTYDAAVAWWQSLIGRVTALAPGTGVDGFKLDYGEEVLVELFGSRLGFRFHDGSTERTMHREYSMLYHRAYEQVLARDRVEDGGFVIGRASGWGGQAEVDAIWPGDLDSDFSVHDEVNVGGLPAAVIALQTLGASGFVAFGSDTGGYREGAPTAEVLIRWAQHAALSPILQLGGGGPGHYPWKYDAATVDLYRRYARLHTDLVPYLYALASRASTDGTPVTLALPLAFPNDPAARAEPYEYMLGDALLVAPVVTAGAGREVYLPAGRWVDYFTREVVVGPARFADPAPLDRLPLFLLAGAILPLGSPDIDTYAPVTDPTVIGAGARASILLARAVPEGSTERLLADGARITLGEDATGITLGFAPGAEYADLRATIDLAASAAGAFVPAAIEDSLGPLVPAPDAATVLAGCARCAFYDPAQGLLYLGVHGAATVSARR